MASSRVEGDLHNRLPLAITLQIRETHYTVIQWFDTTKICFLSMTNLLPCKLWNLFSKQIYQTFIYAQNCSKFLNTLCKKEVMKNQSSLDYFLDFIIQYRNNQNVSFFIDSEVRKINIVLKNHGNKILEIIYVPVYCYCHNTSKIEHSFIFYALIRKNVEI